MDIYYKGFFGKICYSAEADVFYGEILNSEHLITFQAKAPKDAELAMREAVNQYLQFACNEVI